MGAMRGRLHGFVLLVALSASLGRVYAGSLRKVWELNLKDKLIEDKTAHIFLPTVFALRFSPDGKHVAVVIEEYRPQGSEDGKCHLLIVPAQRSDAPVRQFDIQAGIDDSVGIPAWPNLNWTASGDAIVAGDEVIQLADRKSCRFSPGSRVAGSRLVIGKEGNFYADAPLIARYLLTDASCQEGTKWEFSADWTVEDVSLGRRLICVTTPDGQQRDLIAKAEAELKGEDQEILIVDPFGGRIVQRWPTKTIRFGDVRFADNGRAICSGRQADNTGKLPVACWDVDTGIEIAETSAINTGTPIAASVQMTRIVASDYRRVPIPFSHEVKEVLKRRVVWDFRTGKELASWHPELQSYDIGMKPVDREWFAFTISPDGQYVAEGGDGVLRVYKIEP